jgi:hypothetical protein
VTPTQLVMLGLALVKTIVKYVSSKNSCDLSKSHASDTFCCPLSCVICLPTSVHGTMSSPSPSQQLNGQFSDMNYHVYYTKNEELY